MAEAKTSNDKTEKPAKGKKVTEIITEKTFEPVITKEKITAKAGKRSIKAIKEAEEKQIKEARKSQATQEEAEKPKKTTPKTIRSKLERKGKKFRNAAELIEKDKEYSLKEALELAVKTSTAKFDTTVELHANLNVDPKQADQNVRGTVVLPAGTGKNVRVAVFAEADDIQAAKKAGADTAGNEEILTNLEKGTVDFDVLIATPELMPKLGKYARLLGPKGLMPNPKSGTVAKDVAKAVSEAKAGRVEYRVDSTGIIHVGIGKVSFSADKLEKNAAAIVSSIKAAKPASLKGVYVKSLFIATSMGPSVKVKLGEIS